MSFVFFVMVVLRIDTICVLHVVFVKESGWLLFVCA
jgi:hypothetical protein